MHRHRRCQPRSTAAEEDALLGLARAFERARGRHPTMDELRALDAWATQTRLNGALLRLVLTGAALVDLGDDGHPSFSVPR